ncbi:MAG TPA: CheR family methyltransferase, partial [Longimicrobiales bacterium]|nr:CheR family methyltransferase [Longimicrobiales bacterium]
LGKAPMHGMNIIFCQNLLIYFRRWRRRDIVKRLAERLAPGLFRLEERSWSRSVVSVGSPRR